MKKYTVIERIEFVKEDGRQPIEKIYECESIESKKNWTGECIRLEGANSVKGNKRKEFKRGQYVTVERMSHWSSLEVIVIDNETNEVVREWKDRVEEEVAAEAEEIEITDEMISDARTFNNCGFFTITVDGKAYEVKWDGHGQKQVETDCPYKEQIRKWLFEVA